MIKFTMQKRIAENTRIYAIGDIHGCIDPLTDLIKMIVDDNLQRPRVKFQKLIFLGDYVDRGPASNQVIEFLLEKLPDGFDTVFLKGNHEAMLLDALEHMKGFASRLWLKNGGRETVASYDNDRNIINPMAEDDILLEFFAEKLPQKHLDFLQTTLLSTQCGDYFFAHAGVHPDRPLSEQKEQDLLWIRDRFLFCEEDFGKIIVHGHTPAHEVDWADNRIGIDTAAVYGGTLTALMLEGGQRKCLHTKAKKT